MLLAEDGDYRYRIKRIIRKRERRNAVEMKALSYHVNSKLSENDIQCSNCIASVESKA